MKRFYKEVGIAPSAGGFAIRLDAKPVKTPAGRSLVLPTERLALAVAEEWRAQGADIVAATMALLQLSNTAIDGVMPHRADTIGAIERFGENDLLCYRAPQPEMLLARQCEGWDPWLEWARQRHGVAMTAVLGLVPARQSAQALGRLRHAIEDLDAFSLAGLHVIVSLTGSLVLGLAAAEGALGASKAFQLSRIDETYQAQKWGEDPQAAERARALEKELEKAVELIALVRRDSR